MTPTYLPSIKIEPPLCTAQSPPEGTSYSFKNVVALCINVIPENSIFLTGSSVNPLKYLKYPENSKNIQLYKNQKK